MTTDDTYEGWSNRETWAANLWLANTYSLYLATREQARDALVEAGEEGSPIAPRIHEARYALGNLLQEQFDQWAADIVDDEPTTEELRRMILDIGSLYRVDWHEVAEGWVSEAAEELDS